MGKLSRPIAEALRNSLRVDAERRAGPRAPGMVLPDAADATDEVELATPAADELLDLLRRVDPVTPRLLTSIRIVAAQTRAAGEEGKQPEPLHVPTAEGGSPCAGSAARPGVLP